MNQDIVKQKLMEIDDGVDDFELIFTGKASKKVNGFYRPDEKKIYIHNRNMKNDNQIIYTAIHEYAHHLHCSTSAVPISNRCHTKEFWYIFHTLLQKAEAKGIYQNPIDMDDELRSLTDEIKENYLHQNGELMKGFGQKLVQAQKICQMRNISFEDYADRVLGLGSSYAKNVMKVSLADIDSSIGYENMKTVASIPKGESRNAAIEAIKEGQSPVQIKTDFAPPSKQKEKGLSIEERLKSEKTRLEKTIDNLSKKLTTIEERLAKLDARSSNQNSDSNAAPIAEASIEAGPTPHETE